MNKALYHIIPSSVICVVLIALRCGYRLLCKCKIHVSCHRTWHQDDAWMAFAVLPLTGRSVCVGLSRQLDRADAPLADLVLAQKLFIPARVCFALLCVYNQV